MIFTNVAWPDLEFHPQTHLQIATVFRSPDGAGGGDVYVVFRQIEVRMIGQIECLQPVLNPTRFANAEAPRERSVDDDRAGAVQNIAARIPKPERTSRDDDKSAGVKPAIYGRIVHGTVGDAIGARRFAVGEIHGGDTRGEGLPAVNRAGSGQLPVTSEPMIR